MAVRPIDSGQSGHWPRDLDRGGLWSSPASFWDQLELVNTALDTTPDLEEAIARLQQGLADAGEYDGPIDGRSLDGLWETFTRLDREARADDALAQRGGASGSDGPSDVVVPEDDRFERWLEQFQADEVQRRLLADAAAFNGVSTFE